MAKEYFSHDLNSRNDRKMVALIHDFKACGYGVYWGIVEMLHEEGGYLEFDEITCIAIAKNLEADITVVRGVIEKGINTYKLFQQEGTQFTSARVIRNAAKRQDIREERAKAGKASGNARKKGTKKEQPSTESEQNATTDEQNRTNGEQTVNKTQQRKGKEIKEKEIQNPTHPKNQNIPSATPPAVAGKNEGKGKDEQPPEPYWQELVKVFNDFVVEKFKEPPLFAGQDPKFLKSIVQKLKKRASQAKPPVVWDEKTGPERMRIFLEWAFKDEWLAKHFILKNLDSKFEEIGRDPKKAVQASQKQDPPCSETDIQFLYDRFLDGDLDAARVLTTHFDLLAAKGKTELTQDVFPAARAKRVYFLTGSNHGNDCRLREAYEQGKTGETSPEIKADNPKLIAVAKRLSVLHFFEKSKASQIVNIF